MKVVRRQFGAILRRLGTVRLNKTSGAYVVTTKRGAVLELFPFSDEDLTAAVHIDSIDVEPSGQRRGIATEALTGLCGLADEFGFELKGGPIGFSDDPWGKQYVRWLSGFGAERDPSPPNDVDDKTAFYARRLPRTLRGVVPPL